MGYEIHYTTFVRNNKIDFQKMEISRCRHGSGKRVIL